MITIKQVTAQLYLVPKRMVLEPGQYVMVIADVVVGVYTGRPEIPVLAQVQEQPPPSARKQPPPTAKHKQRTNNRERIDGDPLTSVQPVIRAVVALLNHAQDRPMYTTDIVQGVERQLPNAKSWQVRDALNYMSKQGWTVSTGWSKTRRNVRTNKMPDNETINAMWQSNKQEAA